MKTSLAVSIHRLICVSALAFPFGGFAQTGIALVQHAPEIKGSVDGSIHQMLPENIVLEGSAAITGLLVPGSPLIRVNGNPEYGDLRVGAGAIEPSGYQITIGGSVRIAYVQNRSDPVTLPPISPPPAPSGTRSVILSNSQSLGDFATVRDLTVGGSFGQVHVPPGSYGVFTAHGTNGFTLGSANGNQRAVYNFQKLVLSGKAELRVLGPVVVTLGEGLEVSGTIGSSEQPHWLQLRIAAGDFTLNGGARIFVKLSATHSAVVARGGSEFVGGLSSDRLIVSGGASLRLVNEPPTVSLTSPLAGAAITSKPVGLVASADDTDGTVVKVEFYVDGIKIGGATEPPYAATWSPTVGFHTLTARAYDDLGANTDSVPCTVRVLPELPYIADFELAEGFKPGALTGQQAWVANGDASITAAAYYSGAQSVLVPAGTPASEVSQNFVPQAGQPVVFVDLFTRPVADTNLDQSTVVSSGSARVALLRDGTTGTIHAFDGNGAGGGLWRASATTKPLTSEGRTTNWIRLTLREDHMAKRWDLFSDGVLIAADLRFLDDTTSTFSSFSFQGHSTTDSRFDYFYAGPDNPLFVDGDRDGIDDAWEQAHGLSPSNNDRGVDLDGDGIVNVQEYAGGTDPRDYYNGVSPSLVSLLDASGQAGPLGEVALRVSRPDGTTLSSAPVTFTLGSTSAQLAATSGGAGGPEANVRTGPDGIARVYLTFSTYAPAGIVVVAGSSSVSVAVQPPRTDADGDNLPDLWETTHFGSAGTTASADTDGDGFTSLDEFEHGSSPTDYYNGVLPQTESLVAESGALAADGSIAIRVRDAAGNLLFNAPVTFAVKEGGHKLAGTPDGPPLDSVEVRTDASGVAKAYVLPGSN